MYSTINTDKTFIDNNHGVVMVHQMIKKGDQIMLWSPKSVELIKVDGKTKRVHGLGVVDTGKFVGRSFGSKVNLGRDVYHLVKPSLRYAPEFMKRGPQIVQPMMASVIIHECDIGCGHRVVEGGAGSGMLSTALLRAVGTQGKLYTYELEEEHLRIARKNVESLDLQESWIPRIGDVTKDVEEVGVDAFVVDIPQPWDALHMAKKALNAGGAFLAYVPTVNQVERTYNHLIDRNFIDIQCSEVFQRNMLVTEGGVRPSFDSLGHNGYAVRGTKSEE